MGLFGHAGRRTNLALLALLAAALATGAVAFGVGTPTPSLVVTVLHGAAGLGVLLLVPWKSVIVRRSVRGAVRRGRPRVGSVVLAVLVVVSIGSGVLHAVTGAAGPVSALQVHVGAALLAIPFALAHVSGSRQRPRRTDLSRRTAVRTVGLAGASVLAWGAIEGASALLALPGARRRETGSHPVGSGRQAAMPVTQWFTDTVPEPDDQPAALRVTVLGSPRTHPYADLDGEDTVRAVLDCTGGWYSEQEWRGTRLDALLGPVPAAARSVEVVSVTGYRRRFPIASGRRLLLATSVAGEPLSAGHGAPLRLVAPGRRGFWWVKWVAEVRVLDDPAWWQPPFPPQ